MRTKLTLLLSLIVLSISAQDKVVTRDLAIYDAQILSLNSKGISCRIGDETITFSAEELSTVTLSNGQVKTYNSPIKGAVEHYPNSVEKQTIEEKQEESSIQTEKYDVIVLNNSSRIDAKITEVGDTEIKYKKISNLDGPTYVQKTSDIAAIIYKNGEIVAYKTNNQSNSNSYQTRSSQCGNKKITFQSYVEVGALFGKNNLLDDVDKLKKLLNVPISIDYSMLAGPSVDFVAGARLNDYLFLGVGLGFQLKTMTTDISTTIAGYKIEGDLRETMLSLPLYVNARVYYPKNIKCMPYFDLSIGGNFGLTDQLKIDASASSEYESYKESLKWANGFLLKVGLGLDIKRFSIGIGYQMTRLLGKIELPEYGKISISDVEDIVQHDIYEHMGYVKIGVKLGKLR
ncbi:MAG: PorT family protein [Paludibacteraceae bacterium]|nr:PorT family protein [Paludibacteraceae bacterium]